MINEDEPHFIYIIGTKQPKGVGPPIKVGITANPNGRLATISTSSPQPIDFVCVFEMPDRNVARFIEKDFHDHHPDLRTNGEWFNCPPRIAAEWICERYKLLLEAAIRQDVIDREDMQRMLWHCGVWAAEEKMAADRYLRAWEQAA